MGADALFGESGADFFVFELGAGLDTILDFQDGADVIAFRGENITFATLSITASGSDSLIHYGTNEQITLQNVAADFLTTDDFVFNLA